jgi:outer membrane protein OmpA-like peptidoglycan-associated protein/Tol biopolymer transport system component
MITRLFILFITAGLLAGCSAQKRIQKSFRLGKYQKVIDHYTDVLKKDPNSGPANYYVAEAFRLSNRIKQSENFYAKAGGPKVDKDTVRLYYSESLQANGKYDDARQQLNLIEAETKNEQILKRVRKELDGINQMEKLVAKESYYKIKNMETLNTPFAEYAPGYLNGELYFTSSRGNARIYEATGTPFSDLYKAETKGANVDVNTITPLPELINDSNINEGCITFSPDGRVMIFGKGNSGKKRGAPDVDLYISRFRNGAWSEPTQININQPESWESTPAFSPDGRTLYFSSNRKGGFGGLDIYSAQMDSRGRFGRIRNLGAEINTPGNEMFPYIAENSKLYFSSDGHGGYGMLDLFVVNRVNGKTMVENLGSPVNSTSDDFGIFLFKPDRGFFTSNREGGKGDDDLYTFVNEDPNLRVVNYYLQGITYTTKPDSSREILPETRVSLLDETGQIMQDFVTGNDGKFLFRIYENENYTLVGETDGYLVKRQSYTTHGKTVPLESLKELVTNITLDTLLVLDKIDKTVAFRLNNVYFELDQHDIRADAAAELDKLVELLNDNPEINIEMSSHTDSIASHDYNIALSQRRAESTVNYLVKKGIARDRLTAKGYGETKPVARNTNPDGTDNFDGRQRNRRTEFRILSVGAIPQKKDPDDEFDEDKYFKNNNN